MEPFQKEFIEFAIKKKALQFGDFTLKSGRKSPYFFNTASFQDGESLTKLGEFYAAAIEHAGLVFDMLYGPAYKGIPLISSTAIALNQKHQKNYPYCFNRKEIKDHGEGGMIVGTPLSGHILIVDDVISSGTSIDEAMQIISAQANVVAVIVAMDRQECGINESSSGLSAMQTIAKKHGIDVKSIIKLDDIINYLKKEHHSALHLPPKTVQKIDAYRNQYGT